LIRTRFIPGILISCLFSCFFAAGAQAQESTADLSRASLEDLTQMKISVSSFARKDEDLWKTPAAVFVISREDIARSAATSIPELLRIVPGMQVAQIDASTWAVSARGFNSAFADKLLVLVDGRSVYSEIYSGVPWDQVNIPLGDIERIEVIRGPGAAVWGTNAVNGVVNIITRRAHSTLGVRASRSIGRINRTADVRYGGTLGDRAQYRAFANYILREPLENADGTNAFDGEDTIGAGGRLDWQRTWADWITLAGDVYGGHLKQQTLNEIALPIGPDGQDRGSIAGGYLLGRWEHKRQSSDSALQVYYDDQSRHQLSSYGRTRTADIDFQDHVVVGRRNDLVWGGEFRYSEDDIKGIVQTTTRPVYRNYLVDGFIQDEYSILPDRLIATFGSKIQTGNLAGFQVQPSVRLLWAITPKQSTWAAVSRAAVAPAIHEKGIYLPLNLGVAQGLPIDGLIVGNPNFQDESVVAYEEGYRTRLASHLTLDLAGFYNRYRHIQSLTSDQPTFVPTPTPHVDVDLLYSNGYRASTEGIEASLSWKPFSTLSFQGSYAWMQAHSVQVVPGTVSLVDAFSTPKNSFAGTASWNFAPNWSANSFISFVGPLATQPSFAQGNRPGTSVPGYTRLDFHVSRKLGRNVAIDAGGTNLLSPRHLEFGDGTDFVTPDYVPRSVFVNAAWSF
jgi:iron complex outermembrane receptor protein